jgi:hypothetical protein
MPDLQLTADLTIIAHGDAKLSAYLTISSPNFPPGAPARTSTVEAVQRTLYVRPSQGP